jgi:hypothetical protein
LVLNDTLLPSVTADVLKAEPDWLGADGLTRNTWRLLSSTAAAALPFNWRPAVEEKFV